MEYAVDISKEPGGRIYALDIIRFLLSNAQPGCISKEEIDRGAAAIKSLESLGV